MSGLLNAKEYAKHRGVSHVAVAKWIAAGKLGPIGDAVVKKGRTYLIDTQKADAYFSDLARQTNQTLPFDAPAPAAPPEDGQAAPAQLPPGAKSSAVPNLNTYHGATAWRAKYEALAEQWDYEIKTGKYVLAEEVQAAAFSKGRLLRDTLLNIPERLAPILAAEADEEKVYQLLSTEIRSALEEVAQ